MRTIDKLRMNDGINMGPRRSSPQGHGGIRGFMGQNPTMDVPLE